MLVKRNRDFTRRFISTCISGAHDTSGTPLPCGGARAPSRCASCPLFSCAWLITSHEAYPPLSVPPNVPARTLGDARDYGLAPWFAMSAVNTPVLRRILESPPERTDEWLPVHLRGRKVPPPPGRRRVANPASG